MMKTWRDVAYRKNKYDIMRNKKGAVVWHPVSAGHAVGHGHNCIDSTCIKSVSILL